MKSYEERLPLIDAAIENFNGDMPSFYNALHVKQDSITRYSGVCEHDYNYVCTRDEFNQRKVELAAKEQDMNDNWYERGELPPVGSVVEARTQKEGVYLDWKTVEICGYHSDFVWFRSGSSYLHGVFPEMQFRPLRTEMDNLVNEAMSLFSQAEATSDAKQGIEHAVHKLIEAGYRKIEPMGDDEFMSKVRTMTKYEMYRAGCRFIEQVKV